MQVPIPPFPGFPAMAGPFPVGALPPFPAAAPVGLPPPLPAGAAFPGLPNGGQPMAAMMDNLNQMQQHLNQMQQRLNRR